MSTDLFAERYRIIRQIAEGGMGVVFEAEDELLKKTVAIKTIRKGFLKTEQVLRFQREAKALASLNHPNLVSLYVFGLTDDNEPYMVMSFEDGMTLAELINGRGRLPLFKSINMFIQIADAMQHAHEHGVLHRDLKPGNIMVKEPLSDSPSVVVLDFGVAIVDSGSQLDALTKTGVIVGTPAYMSPEQVKGQKIDERTDVYALGCIMFETLTGKTPFTASSTLEILSKKTSTNAPVINREGEQASFPVGIGEIVAKALVGDSTKRYQSMAELKADLLAFKSGEYKTSTQVSEADAEQKPLNSKATLPVDKKRLSSLVLPVSAIVLTGLIIFLMLKLLTPNAAEAPPIKKPEEGIAWDKMSAAASGHGKNKVVYKSKEHMLELDGRYDDKDLLSALKEHPDTLKLLIKEGTETAECFEQLGKGSHIRMIETHGCDISERGLKAISHLPEIQKLSFHREMLTAGGLAALSHMTNLRGLDATRSFFDKGVLPELLKLKQLEALDLNEVKDINDNAVSKIVQEMPRLRWLSLSKTKVTKSCLQYLVRLRYLDGVSLVCLHLSDRDLLPLRNIRELHYLDVRGNHSLTDNGLKVLAQMTQLSELRIDDNMGSKAGRQELMQALDPRVVKVEAAEYERDFSNEDE